MCVCVCVLCRVGKTSGREATTQMTTATPVLQIMLPMGRTPTQVGTSENAYLCTPAPFCWGRSWYIVWSHFVKYLLQLCQNLHHTPPLPQWGTVDTEIKVPYVENPELTNALPLKSGEGQYVALHALPTARNYFLVLISTFPVHSPSFFLLLQILYILTALVLANFRDAVSCVDLWNKISDLLIL